MTLDDTAALEALYANAEARGAWRLAEPALGDGAILDGDGNTIVSWDSGPTHGEAALIAAAVNALPALLALARRALKHERATARVQEMRPALAQMQRVPDANPLDTPEVREAVARAVFGTSGLAGGVLERATVAILAALAPHVAAAHRVAFHRGREAGRADAAQACERYAARAREARDVAHDFCDDAEEADCARAVHVAEAISAYIETLGPVEDADEPAETAP